MNVSFLPCDFCPSGQNNQIVGQLCPLLISHARDTPNAFGESQDLNLVFSGSLVFSLRASVQPVRGPRGSSRRAPPKEEELKQHHLNRGRSPRNTRPYL